MNVPGGRLKISNKENKEGMKASVDKMDTLEAFKKL